MKRVHTLIYSIFFLVVTAWASAGPNWEIRLEPSELVKFESQEWHERDGYWLFTSRLSTASENKIKRISHVAFTAYGESEEDELWVLRKTIRRDDLDSKIGGLYEYFMRVHLRDVPMDAKILKIEFVNLPKSAVEDESE